VTPGTSTSPVPIRGVRIARPEHNWSSSGHDQDVTEALVTMHNLLQQRQPGKSVLAAQTLQAYKDSLRTARRSHG